jgi:hypothetical protein
MRNPVLACIFLQALSIGVAAASIIPPTMVSGKSSNDGATTDPRIKFRAVLLSHGKVECQMTLRESLLDADWVTLNLRDGTDHVLLSARLEGIPSKDGNGRLYTFYIDRLAIKNSYCQVAAHSRRGENLWVLLGSVEIYDDWTHAMGMVGRSEEQLNGTLGPPDYDSRKVDSLPGSGPYELRWCYGEGKDISATIQDQIVIKVSHWRDGRPESGGP